MKSRIYILTLTAMLVALPAHADWAETQAKIASAWHQVKTTVNETVTYWIGRWNAPKTQPEGEQNGTAVANGSQPSAATPAPVQSAPVPAMVTEAAKQLHDQPIYTVKAEGSSLQEVQTAQQHVKSTPLLKVAQPGRAGTTKLPKTKSGVPLTNFAQMKIKGVKQIPRLDIGTESLVSREDFTLSGLHWGVHQPAEFKKLPQPQLIGDSETRQFTAPVLKTPGPRGLEANLRTSGHPVTLEQVQKVSYTLRDFVAVTEKPYSPLSEDQMKMVAALIIYDKGKRCPMIMGLFHQLTSVDKMKLEATYHLGACAAELKLYQAAFENLSKVIASEDMDYASSALTILAGDLPAIYEKDFYKLLKGIKGQKEMITEKAHDDVAYRAAKGAYRAGEFKASWVYAEQVTSKSPYHKDARFLIGMDQFALGEKAPALKTLQDLLTMLGKNGESNLRALTTVNLARMYFAQKKYDKALEHYMQVPKDHPLWVQALIEQGWTQIASQDFAGAIGNMYSLHSPYFKAVYQPESFVVRTIGYLNICQYGDAYKTLTWLEKDYREWYGKTSHYLENKSKPADIYATVKSYIRGKSNNDIDGVPFQIWREMAHRKDFLNMQTALNEKVDESKRFDGVNTKINEQKASIAARAEKSKNRFEQLRTQIAKGKIDPAIGETIDEMRASQKTERELTISYRFQLTLLELGRKGYMDFQAKSHGRLDHETAQLSEKTGEILLTHAKNMEKEMSRVLENNEFLRYEVFSGSGENIRYQVAGGQVSGANRIPAHIKPTKMMNWNFDGEFWEDEIGSYRSSLQNSCPKSQTARKAGVTPEQARHNEDDGN